jgi:hypothetical protein
MCENTVNIGYVFNCLKGKVVHELHEFLRIRGNSCNSWIEPLRAGNATF